MVHAGAAEKTADIEHGAPLEVNPVKLYAAGDANGALKVCVPPQEPVIVKVPDVGAFVNEMFPETVYKFVAGLHAPTFVVIPVILQGKHAAGAVKLAVRVHVASAEKVAVTTQAAPFEFNPVKL